MATIFQRRAMLSIVPTVALFLVFVVSSFGQGSNDALNDAKQASLTDQLFQAVKAKNQTRVKLLLNQGVSPNAEATGYGYISCGYPVLMVAAQDAKEGDVSLCKLLIDKGADVNGKGEFDDTALTWAARRNNLALAKLLLSKGANPNVTSRGVSTGIRDGAGDTPLSAAVRKGSLPIVTLLLDAKADPNLRAEDDPASVLDYAVYMMNKAKSAKDKSARTKIQQVLLKHGAKIFYPL